MLSSKAIDALVECSRASYTIGNAARRAAAREAVSAAAAELGFDPLKPPLPRFAAGEQILTAAVVRVLAVPGVERELEQSRARVDACRAAAERLADLRRRCDELQRVELGRIHDQIMAGKVPGAAPADAIAERQKIAAELELVGSANVEAFVRESDLSVAADAAMRPDVFASVMFYAALVEERLRLLTADERHGSPAVATAKAASAEVANLAKRSARLADPALARKVRAARAAVELADLHLLQERHAASVEELETAAAGR